MRNKLHLVFEQPAIEPEGQINYRAASAELRAAWFAYKSTPGATLSVAAFAAGFNAAQALCFSTAGAPAASAPTWAVKCDECKAEIRRTTDVRESYQGGTCDACKPPVAFEVGKTYRMRSTGDHNCIWECKVVSRTKKQVTLEIDGERQPIRRGITIWKGVERCAPFGRYSMSPQISADREAK